MSGLKHEGDIHLKPGDEIDVRNFSVAGLKPGESRPMRVVGMPEVKVVVRIGNVELTETSIHLEPAGSIQKPRQNL
jgi:hypothetical protein